MVGHYVGHLPIVTLGSMSVTPAQIVKTTNVDEFVNHLIFSPVQTSKYNAGKTINLTYNAPGGMCRILLQTPRLRIPFGLSKFDAQAAPKFSMQFEFVTDSFFLELMNALDRKALLHVHANQNAALGVSGKSAEIIQDRQNPIVKKSDTWPDSFRTRVEMKAGKWPGIAVDASLNPIDIEDIKTGEGIGIIELGPLWLVNNSWGIKIVLRQLKYWPTSTLTDLLIEDETPPAQQSKAYSVQFED